MIKIGIIGGAGYTAGELIRLLLNHPDAEITFVNSTSNAGNKITDVHSGLYGETDLVFTDELPLEQIDLLFFCTAHGDTKKFMESHTVPENVKIIDLSMDYRIESPEHDFVYGLPELNRRRIATPGILPKPRMFAPVPISCFTPGQTSDAELGIACKCNHGINRSRRQAVVYLSFQLAKRQHFDLQTVHAPASGRDRTELATIAKQFQQCDQLYPSEREFLTRYLRHDLFGLQNRTG